MPDTIGRSYPTRAFDTLVKHGVHPVLARIYAARGIEEPEQLDVSWRRLIPFDRLKNASAMAALLADAIFAEKRLLIVADYDADGATACAVGIRALKKFGAVVDYLVPNRFEFGYGLTPEIVRLAAAGARPPDIIITVDNGIASVEGVAEASRLGIKVLITDHHLPGEELPGAAAIVNPNQPGCIFPSKHLAGVGVMFYMMLALRAELRARNVFSSSRIEPNLGSLLDLVALGTIADVVMLDDNNRILVHQGLERIRRGRACAGISALLRVTQRNCRKISTYDLAFVLGPRLNAAGRLDDMALGIECLITDDETRAAQIALQLDALNRQRREIEADMRETAVSMVDTLFSSREPQPSGPLSRYSLSLFDPGWHQGVIGILASRLKEKFHRPVIAFAPGSNDEIKGSGRSIKGFHLRDALDLVSKRHSGLLLKFGGHAAAAGLTIRSCDFEKFRDAFEQAAQVLLKPSDLISIIETDGDLDESEISLELARHLTVQPWGQGFTQPAFNTRFLVANQRIVGDKHLKLKLKRRGSGLVAFEAGPEPAGEGRIYDGMLFFHTGPLPDVIDAVYRVQINEFNGDDNLQFILEHWKQCEA
ncbi:MAG: single-stranded-DNA-specific exonuclease RecJ [Nitrosospira sp. 56-18]|jgi:single-stranded-DNA-specific exonuclease|nr:single-stranded-DNA-specific exonuclease RecJ [Nitrosospira sp.]OJY14971.1 MAG: single-stranded-DNA-specific exonuclease RecJ [Nitrosospira sp. 56-18]